MTVAERIDAADAYITRHTRQSGARWPRYDAALEAMHAAGLADTDTVMDLGSGWGDFGVRLHRGTRTLPASGARYVPVDAAIDGTDLEHWTPPRNAAWFVCLEVLEHLASPHRLMAAMIRNATKGVIVTTPNPRTTSVLTMDPTHLTEVTRAELETVGFTVVERSFYGGESDSLLGVWSR